MTSIQRMRTIGKYAIALEGKESRPLPWNFTDTVFRCAWEHLVSDFDAEVSFYVDILGFSTIALDEEYALFTTPGKDLTFACRRHERVSGDYTGHILVS